MQRPALIGALLLVGVGIVLGTTVFRTEIAQATGLAQSVTVNNTAANPVPVHEQGTARVDVTNSSLTVEGEVGIDPAANGVHEVYSVAAAPFSRSEDGTFGSGNPGAFNADLELYTVPAGQRVVITYAAAKVIVPAGEHAIVTLRSDGATKGFLPLTDAGNFAVIGASEFLTGGGPVNIVYGPGATIVVNAFRSAGDGDNNGYVEATVTGFTVPV
jgi:hypothetical protein